MGIDGTTLDFDEFCNVKLSLLGDYQPCNAATVMTAVKKLRTLGMNISDEAVYLGLSRAVWHARFEVLLHSPLVIFDGGHNPEGVDAAIRSVEKYFPSARVNVLTAVMADKDYSYIAKRIASVAKKVYTITPDNPRALSACEYARVFDALGVESVACDSVGDGVQKLLCDGQKDGTPSLICGSLYMYEAVAEAMGI
jgi:dihydrofolate synthase/folylpolyglutamate synthase